MGTRSANLKRFKRWAQRAHYGDCYIYHENTIFNEDRDPKIFAFARELFDGDQVLLYQRPRMDGEHRTWEYVAQRVRSRVMDALDHLSASIAAPDNPHAREDIPLLPAPARGGGQRSGTSGGARARAVEVS